MALEIVASICGVLGIIVMCCGYFRSVKHMKFDDAIVYINDYWASHPQRAMLPKQLQGAFWMSDNPADEIGFSFEASKFDPAKRTLSFYPGGGCCCLGCSSDDMWTYGNSLSGWILYLINRVPFILFVMEFNENYSFANIYLYLFSILRIPSCVMRFEIHEGDDVGNLWKRKSYSCFGPLEGGTYDLIRVIDADGKKLEGFTAMQASINSGQTFQGFPPKSIMQIIPQRLFSDDGGLGSAQNKRRDVETGGLLQLSQ